jgi:hypothetical protein
MTNLNHIEIFPILCKNCVELWVGKLIVIGYLETNILLLPWTNMQNRKWRKMVTWVGKEHRVEVAVQHPVGSCPRMQAVANPAQGHSDPLDSKNPMQRCIF